MGDIRQRHGWISVFLVGSLLLAGSCGSDDGQQVTAGQPAAPSSWGDPCDVYQEQVRVEGGESSPLPLGALFEVFPDTENAWYELFEWDVREATPPDAVPTDVGWEDESVMVVEFGSASPLQADAPGEPQLLYGAERWVNLVAQVAHDDARLFVQDRYPGPVEVVAVTGEEAVVIRTGCFVAPTWSEFVGDALVADAVQAAGVDTELDLFLALIRQDLNFDDVQAEVEAADEVAWDDLAPTQRQIYYGETPEQYFEQLTAITVTADVPDDWLDNNHRLCPFTASGWSECTQLSENNLVGDPPMVELYAYREQGSPLHVYLFQDLPMLPSVPAAWTIEDAPAAMANAGGVLLVELAEEDLGDEPMVLSTDRSLSSAFDGDPVAGDVLTPTDATG